MRLAEILVLMIVYPCYSDPILIENFPGMTDFSANQYHGYLNVTNNHVIHYWFIESQNNVSGDPVILWLSGGPGCSSLFALFTEIGPYLVTSDGQNLVENPYTWNKIANLLFFESPIGVGFSYVNDYVVSNDDTACVDHYEALLQFFIEYPQYKQNDFYVAGESYAGVYIPMLVDRILEYYEQNPINIKGLVIGNGVLDPDLRHNTFISYAYYHGFIDESAWERAKEECCDGDIDECDFTQFSTGFCKYFFDKTHHDARYALLLHRYNMYADCVQKRRQRFKRYALTPFMSDAEKLTCMGIKAVAIFMNRADVRDALLIPRNAPAWRSCGDTIRYQKIYRSMEDVLRTAIDSDLKVLLHYGDLDLVCNFVHGEKFARNLGYQVTEPKVPFAVNGKHAGFITKYGLLEVVIVHGAGHMVPTDKPDVALYILENFIKGSTPVFSQISQSTIYVSNQIPTAMYTSSELRTSYALVSLPQKTVNFTSPVITLNSTSLEISSSSNMLYPARIYVVCFIAFVLLYGDRIF